MMLIAAPYRDCEPRRPPKIISEVRKTFFNKGHYNHWPRLAGDLLVNFNGDQVWCRRRVQIRGGQLHIDSVRENDDAGPSSILRLPLRHLSLQAGPFPLSLSICRGHNVVLTLQMKDDQSFDEWAQTVAIELLRQTPIDAIKYLDILTLSECWSRSHCNRDKDYKVNGIDRGYNNYDGIHNRNVDAIDGGPPSVTVEAPIERKFDEEPSDDDVVEDLLKKCQNVDTYVPVKDKLFLFESLCKTGRKVRSSEDVSLKPATVDVASKRTKSCQDLSKLKSQIVVREICKYFENQNVASDTSRGPKGRNKSVVFCDMGC